VANRKEFGSKVRKQALARSGKICEAIGCDKSAWARGLCSAHYKRFSKYGDPLGGGPSLPHGEALKYYRDVVLTYEGSECLAWPFDRNQGYGRISVNGKKCYVSRLVCEARHGPPPGAEYEAAHTCGKGSFGCVAKNHLAWKTSAENKADTLIHGTRNRGSRHGASKLTEADVVKIRSIQGISQQAIADMFGVSRATVRFIRSRTNWAWL